MTIKIMDIGGLWEIYSNFCKQSKLDFFEKYNRQE